MNLGRNLLHNLFRLHLESMDAKVMLETRVRLSHRAGGLAFCREKLNGICCAKGFPPITSQRWKSILRWNIMV